MVFFISGTSIDGGIYRHDRNKETRPMMVLECDEAVGGDRIAIALMDRAIRLGLAVRTTGGYGGRRRCNDPCFIRNFEY